MIRRWIILSAFGHGIVLAALLWMPAPKTAELPGVITVDLVALAAPAAAGKPASLPKPVRPKPLPPAPEPAAAAPLAPTPPVAEVPKPKPPTPEPPKPLILLPQNETDPEDAARGPRSEGDGEPEPKTNRNPSRGPQPKPPAKAPRQAAGVRRRSDRGWRAEGERSSDGRRRRAREAEKPALGGTPRRGGARVGRRRVDEEALIWLRPPA